ncbi:MAG: hypothetical protein JWN01_27 [Patescibacteria group bacterium]|nr:hypothetical protein [Patescibacteria group bacterium]
MSDGWANDLVDFPALPKWMEWAASVIASSVKNGLGGVEIFAPDSPESTEEAATVRVPIRVVGRTSDGYPLIVEGEVVGWVDAADRFKGEFEAELPWVIKLPCKPSWTWEVEAGAQNAPDFAALVADFLAVLLEGVETLNGLVQLEQRLTIFSLSSSG